MIGVVNVLFMHEFPAGVTAAGFRGFGKYWLCHMVRTFGFNPTTHAQRDIFRANPSNLVRHPYKCVGIRKRILGMTIILCWILDRMQLYTNRPRRRHMPRTPEQDKSKCNVALCS